MSQCRDSGSSTFRFLVHIASGVCDIEKNGLNSPPSASITLKSYNHDSGKMSCCSYEITIVGCYISVRGPARGEVDLAEENLAVKGTLHEGRNDIAWVVESMLGVYGPEKLPFSEWTYRNWLLIDHVVANTTSENVLRKTNISRTNWDNMQLCLSESSSIMISDFSLHSVALTQEEIENFHHG